MRVLLVNKFAYVTGGADRYCVHLAEALRDQGHEVAFLSTEHPDNIEREGYFVPCKVTHRTRDAASVRGQAEIAASAMWNPAAAKAMETLIEEFRPDIVHAHKLYPQLSVAPVVIARRSGKPVIQTCHDYEFVSASPVRESGFLDVAETRLRYRTLNSALFGVKRRVHVACVTAWVAPTSYVQRRHASAGIDATVIPYFVRSVADFTPRDHRSGIAFVGRLVEEKGVRHVLELVDAEDTPVCIAGDGDLRAGVERVAARRDNLNYLGWLSEAGVGELLARSAVFVMPSLWAEPGGIAALEAMARGTPVVAYNVGGLAEYVAESEAGIVVAPRVDALRDACRRLLEDDSLWNRYSAHGLDAAARMYNGSAHVSQLCAIYERAADAARRSPASRRRIRVLRRASAPELWSGLPRRSYRFLKFSRLWVGIRSRAVWTILHAWLRPQGVDLCRLGSKYGGWWVSRRALKTGNVAYCAGAGEDITFDLALHAAGLSVTTFDPTPRAISHVDAVRPHDQRFRFVPLGWWDEEATLRFYAPRDPSHVSHSALNLRQTSEFFEARVNTVRALAQELGDSRIDLIKMDIEGAELRVIHSLLRDGPLPEVLCVEFDQPQPLKGVIRAVLLLKSVGYTVAAIEQWNFTFVR